MPVSIWPEYPWLHGLARALWTRLIDGTGPVIQRQDNNPNRRTSGCPR